MKANINIKVQSFIELVVNTILFKILKIKYSEKLQKGTVQFIKFGIVGVSNTLIGYVIYVISLYILRANKMFANCDYLIAQVAMFLLSVLWSFFWNNKVVFTKTEGKSRNIFIALIKTYISYAFTNLFVSSIFLYVLVDIIKINEYVAPIVCLIVTVPLNFIIQKIWAFKEVRNENKEVQE